MSRASKKQSILTEEELFRKVVSCVQSSSSSLPNSSQNISNDTKLRLYGLYKRITIGKTTNETNECDYDTNDIDKNNQNLGQESYIRPVSSPIPVPSRFNVIEWHKYKAWEKCNDISRKDACVEYAKVAATVDNDAGRVCAGLLEEYLKVDHNYFHDGNGGGDDVMCQGDSDDDDENRLEKLKIDKNNVDRNKTVLYEEEQKSVSGSVLEMKRESSKTYSNQSFSFHTDTTSASILDVHERTKETKGQAKNVFDPVQTDEISLSKHDNNKNQSFLERLLHIEIRPFVPRGSLDISYTDLLYGLWQCFLAIIQNKIHTIVPISRFFVESEASKVNHYEEEIAGSWQRMHKHLSSTDVNMNIDASCMVERAQRTSHVFKDTAEPPIHQEIVVGLSVRSLLDLYLSAKNYAAESEIIIVPPITIPGMVDVMKYHNLVIRTVDISDFGSYDDMNANEGCNEFGNPIISVDIQAVKKKITEKTVAIMIVHPFGLVCMSEEEMKTLRDLVVLNHRERLHNGIADGAKIDILEDCAECYTGAPTFIVNRNSDKNNHEESQEWYYAGSKYSDVIFFSFGTIKTSTALGGGIAVLGAGCTDSYIAPDSACYNDGTNYLDKNEKLVADTMKRLQYSIYGQQTNSEFAAKIFKSLSLLFISKHTYLCGLIVAVLDWIGWDYDSIVTNAIKGFPIDIGKDKTIKDRIERKQGRFHDIADSKCMLRHSVIKVRKRPSAALLALLHRRLLQMQSTSKIIRKRIDQCRKGGELLTQHCYSYVRTPLGSDGSKHLFWLYPILVPSPDTICKRMKRSGFDVTRGTSQLGIVNNYLLDSEQKDPCTNAKRMMDQILYLPLSSQAHSETTMNRMVLTLKDSLTSKQCRHEELSSDGGFKWIERKCRNGSKIKYKGSSIAIISGVLLIDVIFFQCLPFSSIVPRIIYCSIHTIIPLIGSLVFLVLLVLFILRSVIGDYYINTSNTFAKYSFMLAEESFPKPESEREKVPSALKESGATMIDCDEMLPPSESVMELDALQFHGAREGDHNGACTNNMALLTGATGFIGSLVLRDLLLHRKKLGLEGGVVVICRPKRNLSALERISKLLNDDIFSFLEEKDKKKLVTVIEGDVTVPNIGMSKSDMHSVCHDMNISHIFHCAASVSFTLSLEEAALSNITSGLQMQELAKKIKKCNTDFLYVSTAFIHGGETGKMASPLPEKLFSLHPYNPLELYESMLKKQSLALAAMKAFDFPNTYTFSKCICEHLLLMNTTIRTLIIRPSIVGPSIKEPYEGWAGNRPSTITAAPCLFFKYPYNLWSFTPDRVPVIPVDVVSRFILARAFTSAVGIDVTSVHDEVESRSSEESYFLCKEEGIDDSSSDSCCKSQQGSNGNMQRIFNAAWDSSSPEISSFLWHDYALTIAQLGSVRGYCGRFVACIATLLTFKIFPAINLTYERFRTLHKAVVSFPLQASKMLCNLLGYKPPFLRKIDKLTPFLDLPLLFFPFTNSTFHFTSQLISPMDMIGERYMFLCALAADRFTRIYNEKEGLKLDYEEKRRISLPRKDSNVLVVGGKNHSPISMDIWWSLTQPVGNFAVRVIGWFMIKVLRMIATEVTVDLNSFAHVACAIEENKLSSEIEKGSHDAINQPFVILTPTHRSFLDFMVLSHICFSVPEMGIDIPNIAAADNFSYIPFLGWLAQAAGAFFLTRGKGIADPQLKKQVKDLKKKSNGRRPIFIEVFLEGKRSRDRRFVKPKTGFLKCIHETGGNHIIVPISISYEGIPDQTSLSCEAIGKPLGSLKLTSLLLWMKNVCCGKVSIGRIHVSAGRSLFTRSSSRLNFTMLAKSVQQIQQEKVLVSNFHVNAGAAVLHLEYDTIYQALSILGCSFWSRSVANQTADNLNPPSSDNERWTIFLQCAHHFAPFFEKSHPKWCSWLNASGPVLHKSCFQTDKNVVAVVQALSSNFDLADKVVEDAINFLHSKGFSKLTLAHIMQYSQEKHTHAPSFLVNVSTSMRLSEQFSESAINPRAPWLAADSSLDSNQDTSLEESRSSVKPIFLLNQNISQIPRNEGDITPSSRKPGIEAFGAWGFKDSYFVVDVLEDGTKYVSMKGNRYQICGKPMKNIIPFLEEETKVKINFSDAVLPAAQEKIFVSPSDLRPDDLKTILNVFNNEKDRVSIESLDRARHGTGHSQEDIYAIRSGELREMRLPDVVVFPKHENEVVEIVSLAAKRNWCIFPFGGGTNVSNATRCPSKDIEPRPIISVDMKLLNKVIFFNEEDSTAHVQAGITGRDLIHEMESRGFTIGHEPDSLEFSTLGGWIATKASGMKRNKYGNIEDIVREVRVVGTNGILWQHKAGGSAFGRVSTGIDLCSMIFGSEGNLGIIISAVVKVTPIPRTKEYESVVIPCFNDGINFVRDVAKSGFMKPASVRLLDNKQFRLGQAMHPTKTVMETFKNESLKMIRYIAGTKIFSPSEVVCAVITFEGTPSEVHMQKLSLERLATKHGGFCAGSTTGESGYNLTFTIAYLRDFAMTHGFLSESFESFCPWSLISEVIAKTTNRIEEEHKERGLPGNPFISCRITQLYDEGACIYFYFCMNFDNVPNPSKVFSEIECATRQTILASGGSLSHHHGIGKSRARFMNEVNSKNFMMVMHSLKQAFDPENIFGARNGAYCHTDN